MTRTGHYGVTTSTRTTWYLYPQTSSSELMFRPGGLVYIRPKSARAGQRGRILQVLPQQGQGSSERALVQLQNEAPHRTTTVKLQQCVPVYGYDSDDSSQVQTDSIIILTRDTHPFRHLCASQITSDDRVLEIGCSTGQASAVILRHTQHWLGFDVSSKMIQQTATTLEEKGFVFSNEADADSIPAKTVNVCKVDVLRDRGRAEHAVRQHLGMPTVVCIDIGGNRDAVSVMRVVQWALSVFDTPPLRLVLVKSVALVDECTTSTDIVERTDKGLLLGAHEWFQSRASFQEYIEASCSPKWPDHPLQAHLVLSPVDETTPICRYHNFHKDGCKKASECPFDHIHCHTCRRKGHTARQCQTRV